MNESMPTKRERSDSTTISVQRFPADNTVVHVTGDLRRDVTAAMQRIVAEELTQPPALLVVDLSEIRAIDTDGIRVLTAAAEIAGELDISFCLVDAQGGPVQGALAAANLTDLFEVFSSVSEARRSAH